MEKKEFLNKLKNVDMKKWNYNPSVDEFQMEDYNEIHDPNDLAKDKQELIQYFEKTNQDLYDFDECNENILVYFERKGSSYIIDPNGGQTWGMMQVFEKK